MGQLQEFSWPLIWYQLWVVEECGIFLSQVHVHEFLPGLCFKAVQCCHSLIKTWVEMLVFTWMQIIQCVQSSSPIPYCHGLSWFNIPISPLGTKPWAVLFVAQEGRGRWLSSHFTPCVAAV